MMEKIHSQGSGHYKNPLNQQDVVRKKLDDLAKTAVIGDVASPIEECWEAMQ